MPGFEPVASYHRLTNALLLARSLLTILQNYKQQGGAHLAPKEQVYWGKLKRREGGTRRDSATC